MTEKNDTDFAGRKIFFLYPSLLMQEKLVSGLAQEEFEAYSVGDKDKLRKLLKKYPHSIVFANISEGMLTNDWDNWINSVMTDSDLIGVDIGIIAYGENADMRQKFTEQLKIRFGYTVMKPDLSAVVKQLVSILNRENAKGRRKFVRVVVDKGFDITVDILLSSGTPVRGTVMDISMAGFSCSLTGEPELEKNSYFTNIKIQLKNQLLNVQGIFFRARMQGTEKVYVFLFAQHASPEAQTEIRKFVHSLLQSRMDSELEEK